MAPATRSDAARAVVGDEPRSLLVLSGDTPLLTTELLEQLVETHRREDAAATVLTFEPEDVRSYGRIVRAEDGTRRSDRGGRRRDARAARAS